MVVEPKILHSADIEPFYPPGGSICRRVVAPRTGCSKVFYAGWCVADPGKPIKRWHTHTYDKGPRYEVTYPKNFEETYLLVQGNGTLHWKVEGRIKQKKVKEGDAIFFPVGVVEHQLVNTGKKTLTVIFVCTPPVMAAR